MENMKNPQCNNNMILLIISSTSWLSPPLDTASQVSLKFKIRVVKCIASDWADWR
jgi:hypothetical protein